MSTGNCPGCGLPHHSSVIFCRACKAERRDRHNRRLRGEIGEVDLSHVEPPAPWISIDPALLRLLLNGLLFAGLFFVPSLWRKYVPVYVKPFSVSSFMGAPDPCHQKSHCMIVYVTPWCPACHGSAPFIASVRRHSLRSNDWGLKLIMGDGDASDAESYAAATEGDVFFDQERSASRALGVRRVPAWFVVARDGKRLVRGSGLPGEGSDEVVQRFLKTQAALPLGP